MSFLSFCTLLIIFSVINGSRLLETPTDITNYIFSHFGIHEKAKCVSQLNKNCNEHFMQIHRDEISNVKKLRNWFSNHEYTKHLNEIGEICPKLKLSEYYHIYLPEMLTSMQENWISDADVDEIVTQTLYGMRLFPLSLQEFNSDTSSLSDAFRLLLLASRSLVNYFVPNYRANTYVGDLKFQQYNNGIDAYHYWSNFIWLRPDPAFFINFPPEAPIGFLIDYWPIYFSYMYEFYFSSLADPHYSLKPHSVFHLDGNAKSNLLQLINEYDFIPWTQSALNHIRSQSHCDVHKLYADFVRVDTSLHYNHPEISNHDRFTFRTYLVLRALEDGVCSMPDEFNSQIAFKWDLVEMLFWNWNTYRQAKYGQLVQILSGFVERIDPFVIAFVGSFEGDYTKIIQDSFGSDLMLRLWEVHGLDFNEYEEALKTLVMNGIINRAKYFWCVNDSQDEAKEEISKLAVDDKLFDMNALSMLLDNVQNDEKENDFLIDCLLLLTDLREDWNFDTAIKKAVNMSIISEILTAQDHDVKSYLVTTINNITSYLF